MGNLNKSAPIQISKLPAKLIVHIFSFLSVRDKLVVCQVCKRWARHASGDQLWLEHCRELEKTMVAGEWDELDPADIINDLTGAEISVKQKYQVVATLWRNRHNHIDNTWGDLPQLNCCVVGDYGVGKSTFVSRLDWRYTGKLFHKTLWPVCAEVHGHFLRMFDTHAGPQYADMRPWVYSSMDVIIILFDVCSSESLDSALNVWVPDIRSTNSTVPILLVGGKVDVRDKLMNEGVEVVGTANGVKAASSIGAARYWEFSAKIKGDEAKIYDSVVQVVASRRGHELILKRTLRPSISRKTQDLLGDQLKLNQFYEKVKAAQERTNAKTGRGSRLQSQGAISLTASGEQALNTSSNTLASSTDGPLEMSTACLKNSNGAVAFALPPDTLQVSESAFLQDVPTDSSALQTSPEAPVQPPAAEAAPTDSSASPSKPEGEDIQ